MVKGSKSEIRGKQQSLVIVVEGAGQARDLSTECRRAFRKLIEGFGVNRNPSIVCGADRGKAFDTFKNFREQGVDVLLLIDSEANIDSSSTPWQYLHDSGVGSGSVRSRKRMQTVSSWWPAWRTGSLPVQIV